MKLSEILVSAGVRADDRVGDADISGICEDSRLVKRGDLFVVMPSARTDTSAFIEPAITAGASAILASDAKSFETAKSRGAVCALIPSTGHRFMASLGRICRTIFGDPSQSLRITAITGTNGKTTTAWMMRDALESLCRNAAYLGTLGLKTSTGSRELSNTTPFPVELWRLLQEVKESGATDLVMETSSHALVQRRLAGVSFDVGVFTNLTQDHLDFHGTMAAYEQAKLLLFTEYAMASTKAYAAAINVDGEVGPNWVADLPTPCVTFGRTRGDLQLSIESVTLNNIRGAVCGASFAANVGGDFNVSNLTSAAAGLTALGFSPDEVARGLGSVTPVPGRFESVPNAIGIGVLVDYAHTPDALEKLLVSTRQLQPKRIITVFGCGGDRDRTKRPKMAAVASSKSDVTVVTSDNPRTENPEAIIEEIKTGLVDGAASQAVVDRRDAIRKAIDLAEPGDVVVIAGKGHEDYQIIGTTKHHMDDREMAREALNARS